MLKVKKIKPMFTALITTMDKYEKDVKIGGLIDTARQQGGLKEYQKVLAVGSSVRNIKVGNKPPKEYFELVTSQIVSDNRLVSGLASQEELLAHLKRY